MEISKMLTISTAHISPATAALLDAEIQREKQPWKYRNPSDFFPYLGIYPKGEWGWIIYICYAELEKDEAARKCIPEDLMPCVELAHANDCSILCLDSDGLTCDLPQYSWDEVTLPACDLS